MSAFGEVTLKYWNGRGLMEVPRMCMAIGGKTFTDSRNDAPPANLEANLGRMPCCQVGDEHIGQSVAINFFCAAENGLMGDNNVEAAQILAVQEHLKELGAAYRSLVPYGTEPSPEAEAKFFNEGATDVSGPADRAGYSSRFLQWFLGRIEASLGNKGFAVGSKLSLADVLLYNTLAEFLPADQAKEDMPQFKREAFGNKAKTDAVVAKHPKIAAAIAAVAANEGVQKHLASRGVQGF